MAEASCLSSIDTARAVVEEAGSAVSPALHKLADTSAGHSEEQFHRVIAEYGLALDIPFTEVRIDGWGEFPILLLSSWLEFIVNLGFDEQDLAMFFPFLIWVLMAWLPASV